MVGKEQLDLQAAIMESVASNRAAERSAVAELPVSTGERSRLKKTRWASPSRQHAWPECRTELFPAMLTRLSRRTAAPRHLATDRTKLDNVYRLGERGAGSRT